MRAPAWVLRWLAAKERAGCSPRTIAHYRWAALRAEKCLRRWTRGREPSRWTVREARALRARFGDVPSSVAILANLARFHGNRVFERAGVPRRGPPKRVRWLTDTETSALLQVARRDRHLRLVCLLGLAQGLRRGDWVRLRLEDIDLDGRRLRIRAHLSFRSPERWVPMHPSLPDAIRDYLWARRRRVRRYLRRHPEGRIPSELFLHRTGGKLVPYRPHGTEKWLGILQRRMAERGVSVRLSSDMLRRHGAVVLARRLLEEHPEEPETAAEAVRAFLRQKEGRTRGPSLSQRALSRANPAPGEVLGGLPRRSASSDAPGPPGRGRSVRRNPGTGRAP